VSGAETRPEGAPLAVEWNGILEGKVTDVDRLLEASRTLDACSAAKFACEVTGGRFSLLPRDTHVSGRGFDEEAQVRFVDALQELIATAAPGSVESTLRSKMVFETKVAETLFAVQRGALEPLTRVRDRRAGEEAALAETKGRSGGLVLGRREVLLLIPLLAIATAIFAWRNGLVDRVLAARAEQLTLQTGPFGEMLSLQVTRSWGVYEVQVRRGESYPKDPAELEALRTKAVSLVERAAADAVGSGGEAWVQLCDDDGEVGGSQRLELRALLADPLAIVRVSLQGRIDAASLRLSLTKDEPTKR
jgi:hypothetical protein